jgi:S-(hydroxymethyl)glutathione dehydrogenase/alcohol dehydrogenase
MACYESRMRAALLESPGQELLVTDDIDIDPDPRAGEVLVRMSHCGVCHSDLHFVDGSLPCPLPVVLGHEAAGVVEAVGAGVTELAPGDKVILTLRPPCGHCYWCIRGEVSICPVASASSTGILPDGTTRLSRQGGMVFRGVGIAAFSEYVVTSASGAIKVPADTPLEIACVIGCAVQTGVGAVLNTAQVEEGATVMVVGLGGIGISIVQGARLAGASRIIGVDPLESRREQSRQFGVTDTVDPAAIDIASAALSLTDSIGVDYAFDAVGRGGLVESCIAGIRNGGTTVMVGVPRFEDSVTVPALFFALGEKKLKGCFLGSSDPKREFPRLLSLWRAGKLDLEGMVTSRRPLEEINQAFADMKDGVGLRTVIEIG